LHFLENIYNIYLAIHALVFDVLSFLFRTLHRYASETNNSFAQPVNTCKHISLRCLLVRGVSAVYRQTSYDVTDMSLTTVAQCIEKQLELSMRLSTEH